MAKYIDSVGFSHFWASLKTIIAGLTTSINGKASTVTYTAAINTTWSGSGPYTKNVTVTGMLAADNPIVDVVLPASAAAAQTMLEAWGKVDRITTAANTITLTCYNEKPTASIDVQLKVVR